jgi:hypothetical protein
MLGDDVVMDADEPTALRERPCLCKCGVERLNAVGEVVEYDCELIRRWVAIIQEAQRDEVDA